MKKSILKLACYVFLFCIALGGYNNIASAEVNQSFVYQEELFKVTYSVNDVWDGSVVSAILEIENTGSEMLENWYLGMALEGEISDIWNATIYEHEEDQYVIKNAVYNSDIAPGERISIGCIIEFTDGIQSPDEFYMPIETKEVSFERYETDVNIVSAWGMGSEYQISIKNASWQTIEDWTMEFDFEGDIISVWNAEIIEKEGSHYRLTNSDYNSVIACGESIAIGFIASDGKSILPKNLTLNEITSEGIKDAEKLVDERNFEDFDFVTEEYEVTPLYTLDGQVSAYLVQYYSSGVSTGYVVVSNEVNCLEYYIEFGTGRAGIINDMVDMVEVECSDEVERVIYVGGYTYYALVGDDVYTIQNAELQQLSEEWEERLFEIGGETQYYE